MPCDRVTLPGGFSAIVCTRGRRPHRCTACHLAGGFQCDWKIAPGKTCDAYLCAEHAKEVAPGKHLCPGHVEAYAQWKAQRVSA